jgi:hypothetical protein
MATIWTRRRGGCVLSATFEAHRTPPCDFDETKQKHTFFLSEEVSLFFALFFFCGGKKRAEKSSQQKSRRKTHRRAQKRPRGMMMLSSNDDDGVHFALTRFFFSLFACRRPLRPPSFCARTHRTMMPMSLATRFLSKQRLWRREKTTTTRERPSTQKRRRRRRRKQPHLISGLRSHSRSRERRGR